MIDFPSSPSIGQTFNSGTGAIYIWDGVAWSLVMSQTKTARQNNLVVNPAMSVSQENGNAGGPSGWYPADQWALSATLSGQALRVQSIISPDNSPNAVAHYFTAAKASLAAGDYCQFMQYIEGQRADVLEWGTAKAIPAVLRFNACCETAGTYTVGVLSSNSDYSWLGSFTCDGSLNMKTFAFPVPAQTVGTWAKDNTIGPSIRFCYAAGTTYGGGVAGWQAGTKMAIAGQANGAAVINKSMFVTDVGLYPDPENTGLPPPFIAPKYSDALIDCMRYWELVATTGVPSTGGSWPFPNTPYRVIKRITSTVAIINGAANGASFVASGAYSLQQNTAATTVANLVVSNNARM